MTPSRELVEAAKRVERADRAEKAAWSAYTDARRERERAGREAPGCTNAEAEAAMSIARAELAKEEA